MRTATTAFSKDFQRSIYISIYICQHRNGLKTDKPLLNTSFTAAVPDTNYLAMLFHIETNSRSPITTYKP